MNLTTTRQLGAYGEELATRYLVDRGLTILARNWRSPLGEIDIIAREASTLVVCEVKTRRGTGFGDPLEAVTHEKARRLRRLAMAFLDESGLRPPDIRIDVIGVLRPPSGPARLEHVVAVGS
jgi:putative endonuclease